MASTIRTRFPAAGTAETDRSLEELAKLLDYAFRIPGTNFRFGLDAIIGLIPGVGDTVSWLASVYILAAAARQGVPRITLVRMATNTAIDLVVGSIPFAGDFFDAWWKSNKRNVELMQKSARKPARPGRSQLGDWAFVGLILLILGGLLLTALATTYYILSFLASQISH